MEGDFYKTAGQRIKQMRIARNHSREEMDFQRRCCSA